MSDARTDEYTAHHLQHLEGLEAVRKRPGMYIGSTDSRGLQHCMWEIIDNSVDEALAGHCSHIAVVLHDDGSVEVRDDGRGIPVDVEPRSGLTGVRLVFEKLHAGGKFGGSGYKVSGGLHGVGASVVNALSERLDVEVDRDGATWALSFCRGEAGVFDAKGRFTPSDELRRVRKVPKSRTGTRVRYWADRQIFLAEATVDLAATHDRARQTAFLVPGLEITVTDARTPDAMTETFCFQGGVADYVEHLAPGHQLCAPILLTGSTAFTETVPVLDGDRMVSREVERTCEVEVALRWGNGFDTTVRSFVNIVATPKGGTHVVGFERALTRALNEAARASKTLKVSEESVVKDDCLEGLTAVIAVKLAEPQFEGQTKEILGTAAAQSIVSQVVSDGLKAFFADRKRKREAKAILTKVVEASRTRRALRLQRETIRKKNALESSSMPAKLADCRSTDPALRELALVEGASAMGTAKAARDSEFQALLPLRGKILNTLRASEKQMLDNAECAAIISAIGAGSGRHFDIEQARYQRVSILVDADVDGSHIRILLLTLFYRYMRPMLEAGRVFAAVPPLYRIEVSGTGEHIYAYSDAERDEHLARLEAEGRKVKEIQRYKGLGEMDADQLAETTMDPEKRTLRRVTMDDAAAAEALFDALMGSDPSQRRDFIVENTHLIDPSRIDT